MTTPMSFEPGAEVECLHGKQWYPALVLGTSPSAEDPSDLWVSVHFIGWQEGTDRFELASAGRLRPRGGHFGWHFVGSPTAGTRKAERRSRQRRRSAGTPAPAVVVDGEQRAELLKRGKGLAKLERLPAAVLAGGLAPPTSGAWCRRRMSKAAKEYENDIRQPLYSTPTAKPKPAHPHGRSRPASQGRPRSRLDSSRPKTAEGGTGARSLRKLDDMRRSNQLPAGRYDKARKRVKDSTAAKSPAVPATDQEREQRTNGTPPRGETPSASKSTDDIHDGSFMGYFAAPGQGELRHAIFGYTDADGQWVAPQRPPTAEELEAQRRAASPPLPDPDLEMRKEQLRVLRAASRTCTAARDALRQHDCDLEEIIRSLDSAELSTTAALKGSRDTKHRAIRSRVYTYRAIAHARNDEMSDALEDLREGLFLNENDAVALKFQARLQQAVATGYAQRGEDGQPVAVYPGQQRSPSRYVPTATAQSKLLGTTGFPSRPLLQVDREGLDISNASVRTDLDEFVSSIERVHRDRPYPEWHHRTESIFAERPPPEPEPERAPSRWDYVLHRVADLIADEEDRLETRELLLAHVATLVEIFDYYCKVSSTSIGEGSKQFAKIRPNEIKVASLTTVSTEYYNAMFKKERMDAPPPHLMTLRQFWQLARDCAFLDDHCDCADVNRVVMLSGRETTQDAAYFFDNIEAVAKWNGRGRKAERAAEKSNALPKSPMAATSAASPGSSPPPVPIGVTEEVAAAAAKLHRHNSHTAEYGADGQMLTSTLSVNDDENPHHPNNRFHAYEYVEALIRCASRYCTEKHLKRKGKSKGKSSSSKRPPAGVGGSGPSQQMHGNLRKKLADQAIKAKGAEQLRLSDCFHAFLSENLLRFSCTHRTMTDADWLFCAPSLQQLATDFRVPLEKIFRYYSVDKPNTVVGAGSGSGTQQFWKVRSIELLDDTMNFNELYRWIQNFELFTPDFKPKDAQKLFARVTGSDEIVAQIHKNNADSEMILDEFIEFLFMLALAHTKPPKDDGSRRKKVVPSKSLRIKKFLSDIVLPKAAEEMPVDPKALAHAVGVHQGAGEGYDGIDSEEEELTGEVLQEVQR
jgi:hypothetical protein